MLSWQGCREMFCRLLMGSVTWNSLFRGNLGRDVFFDPATPGLGIYRTNYTQTCANLYE